MNRIAGVYQILNTANGKRYVGGSRGIVHRMSQHFSDLKLRGHRSQLLQEDYDRYGRSVFQFSILELLETFSEQGLIDLEQKWLDRVHPEYNVNEVAGKYLGDYIRTPEAKEKRRLAMLGVKRNLSDERMTQLKEQFTGEKNPNYGKRFTEEERKAMSERLSGSGNPNFGKHRKHNMPKLGKRLDYSVSFTDPEGIVYQDVKNLSLFCRERGLNIPCMSELSRGKRKQYCGWKQYTP